MGHNLAVVPLVNFYLHPSSSSNDSALDGIVYITKYKKMAAGMIKMANDFETSSNSFFVRTLLLELSYFYT